MLNTMGNITDPVQVPVKPWYRSKLALFGLTIFAIFGGNLLFNWLTPAVSPEQIASVQSLYPTAVEIIEGLKRGDSILNYVGSIFGAIVFVVRVWFTDSLIPQSLKPPRA